ncbi:hypothetical protein [Cerasicoccus frondis]|uniref:hypothetical protein n=1 Tax=Cerasicoccus frondis TaxID=490090 RepID=UPI0028528132|nr:hypothetical protein [Cerasicoccus frondis]
MNPNLRGRRILARDKHLLSLQRELHKHYDIQRSAPLIEQRIELEELHYGDD